LCNKKERVLSWKKIILKTKIQTRLLIAETATTALTTITTITTKITIRTTTTRITQRTKKTISNPVF